MSAAQESSKTIRLQVGAKMFDVDELQFALLASALEESTGLEVEVPTELSEDEFGDVVAAS